MTTSTIIGDVLQVRSSKMGVRTGNATYGTVRDLYGTVSIQADARLINAIREGNAKELAAVTRVVGATVTLEFAANNLAVMADMLGLTYSITGTTPDQVGTLKVLSKSLPYVGFVAGLDDDNGLENAFHIFVPRMKIVADSFRLVNGSGNLSPEFATVQVEARAFFDPAYLEGAANEVQTLALDGATGGTYTLSFGTETTSDIAFDADAATIQAALEALNNIGSGNVTVASATDFTFTFGGTLGNSKLPVIQVDDTNLTGTTTGATVVRTTAGSSGDDLAMTLYEDEQGTEPLLPPAL